MSTQRFHQPLPNWVVEAEMKIGTLYAADCTCEGNCSWIAIHGLFPTGPVRRPRRSEKNLAS